MTSPRISIHNIQIFLNLEFKALDKIEVLVLWDYHIFFGLLIQSLCGRRFNSAMKRRKRRTSGFSIKVLSILFSGFQENTIMVRKFETFKRRKIYFCCSKVIAVFEINYKYWVDDYWLPSYVEPTFVAILIMFIWCNEKL